MSRLYVALLALGLSTAVLPVALPAISPTAAPSTELTVAGRRFDGKALERVSRRVRRLRLGEEDLALTPGAAQAIPVSRSAIAGVRTPMSTASASVARMLTIASVNGG